MNKTIYRVFFVISKSFINLRLHPAEENPYKPTSHESQVRPTTPGRQGHCPPYAAQRDPATVPTGSQPQATNTIKQVYHYHQEMVFAWV